MKICEGVKFLVALRSEMLVLGQIKTLKALRCTVHEGAETFFTEHCVDERQRLKVVDVPH